MPSTWRAHANQILGYVPTQSETNERYVATKMIQLWIEDGFTVEQIALKWNQGNHGQCSSGVNSQGVAYDSCSYAKKVVYHYRLQ